MRVIYLSFDGLLEPLGSSQIVSPLLKLAERGFEYSVVSLEKVADLEDCARRQRLQRDLARVGIEWFPEPFRFGGTPQNVASVFRHALSVAPSATLIHARGHAPTGVAYAVSKIRRIPYLFDMRGFWLEERAEEGNWEANSVKYRAAKTIESELFRSAAAVSCLTDLAADEVRKRDLRARVATITTVADYERFQRSGPTDRIPERLAERLRHNLTISYIGSTNASYSSTSSLALARRVLELKQDTVFLVLTRQTTEMLDLVRRAGLPTDRCVVTSAHHEDMDQWLRLIDWSVLFLNSPRAKLGSMPTKLAELFASGVYVAQHGCNSEVEDWTRRVPTGLWLNDLGEHSLDEAAKRIVSSRLDDAARAQTRALTSAFFSLDSGVAKYESLLRNFDR